MHVWNILWIDNEQCLGCSVIFFEMLRSITGEALHCLVCTLAEMGHGICTHWVNLGYPRY